MELQLGPSRDPAVGAVPPPKNDLVSVSVGRRKGFGVGRPAETPGLRVFAQASRWVLCRGRVVVLAADPAFLAAVPIGIVVHAVQPRRIMRAERDTL